MDSSLHNMRLLARRFGVAVAFVLLCSTLLAMLPPPAQAALPTAMPMHDHAMSGHGMHHPVAQPAPHQPASHHAGGACCIAGQHCTSNCLTPPLASVAIPLAIAATVVPLPHLAAQAVTRPPQPPRRPPKA